MIVTLDTNVVYQAMRSNAGASYYIFNLIREREINIALSIPVFTEYQEVLLRNGSLSDLGLSKKDIVSVLRFIAYIGIPFNTYYLFRPNLKDEDDNIFIELAVSSNSQFLITNNVKDFNNSELIFDDLEIVTPADFIKYWRAHHEKTS